MSDRQAVPDSHDQRLAAAVRPAGWSNPQPRDRYNLVVLGGGTAGLVAAAACAGLGGSVALIEKKALGGDCLNTGCIPSKTLISAARVAQVVRMASEYGINPGIVSRDGDEQVGHIIVDFDKVMEHVRSIRADIAPQDSAARFRDMGVDVFFGEGRFVDRTTVTVDGAELRFSRAILATGSRPSKPAIPGLDDAEFLTSDSIFELRALPLRLAIIGAGSIGCEFAQAFARLGSNVTLFEAESNILPLENPEAASVVAQALRRDGVRVLVNSRVHSVGGVADGAKQIEWSFDGSEAVDFSTSSGDRTGALVGAISVEETSVGAIIDAETSVGAIIVDEILVAAGRKPNVEALGLETAGIEVSGGELVVGKDLRTTNRRVFAAGDVATYARFTHAADAMARIVIRNAFFFGRRRYDPRSIPRCVFTDPELAQVGLRAEDEGVEASYRVQLEAVDRFRTDDLPRLASKRANFGGAGDGGTDGSMLPESNLLNDLGFATVHVNRNGRIVGATIVGVGAGELIGAFVQAIASGTGIGALADLVLPYPTRGLAVRALGDAYQRSRLTPSAARASRAWMGWARRI